LRQSFTVGDRLERLGLLAVEAVDKVLWDIRWLGPVWHAVLTRLYEVLLGQDTNLLPTGGYFQAKCESESVDREW